MSVDLSGYERVCVYKRDIEGGWYVVIKQAEPSSAQSGWLMLGRRALRGRKFLIEGTNDERHPARRAVQSLVD